MIIRTKNREIVQIDFCCDRMSKWVMFEKSVKILPSYPFGPMIITKDNYCDIGMKYCPNCGAKICKK